MSSVDQAGIRDTADRLHSACLHLLRRLRRVDEKMGLSPPKASALSVLVFGGPRSAGELAAIEQVRPPSMTRIVQELEKEGLVRRRRDATDGRVARLEATRKGAAILKRGRSARGALLAEWVGRLTDTEYRAVAAAIPALEKVVRGATTR